MSDDESKYEAMIMQRETERLKITADERMTLAKQRTERIATMTVGFVIVCAISAVFAFGAYTVHVPDPTPPNVIAAGTRIDCQVVEAPS